MDKMSKLRSAGAELSKKNKGLNQLAENLKNKVVRKPTRLVTLALSLNTSQSDDSFVITKKSPIVNRKLALKPRSPHARSPILSKASSAYEKPRNQTAEASSGKCNSPVQVWRNRNNMSPVVVLNSVSDKSPVKLPNTPAKSKKDLLNSQVKRLNKPSATEYQKSSAKKKAVGVSDVKPAWSPFKKPGPKSATMRRNINPPSSASKNAVSSSSDKQFSSNSRSNSSRKRKEDSVEIVDDTTFSSLESFASCSPKKINKLNKDTSIEMTANQSSFSGLQESVSHCLTRKKTHLNMSLHQSFLSLGPLSFDTTFETLPQWIADARRKKLEQPSLIVAKIEYNSSPTVKKTVPIKKGCVDEDKQRMPPPRGFPRKQAKENYDSLVRLQNGKDNITELKSWCFKLKKNKIALQGLDLSGKVNTSTEIVSVKNLRTIKTAKSTYQLVGGIDQSRLEKENVFKSIASHFSNGFPANWKELILRHCKETTGGNNRHEDDSDAGGTSDATVVEQRHESEPEEQVIKVESTNSAATKTRQDKIETSKTIKPCNSKPEPIITNAEYSIDATTKSQLESQERVPVKVILLKWNLQAVKAKHSQWSFCISGQVEGGKQMNFDLEEWNREHNRLLKSTCCAQGFEQIELIGPPKFKSGEQPDFVVRSFEDGFHPYYKKSLKEWQTILNTATVRRSSRQVVPPTKYWKSKTIMRHGDFGVERLPEKKTVLFDPKISGRKPMKRAETATDMSSDDDFTTTIKPSANTVTAQKKKAEYKAKHRARATYRNHDFFSDPDELTTSYDEFNAILSPTAKAKATSSHSCSPMANFVNSQSEKSESDTDDDREEEEVRDRRKKKTYEKFVYHESNKPKRLQTHAKKPVLPSKPTYKKSEVRQMEVFLTKHHDRKKEYDRRIRQGEDSDNSDCY